MRKIFALLASLALSVTVAMSMGTSVAKATTCSGGGLPVGYATSNIPGVGGFYDGNVMALTASYQSGSFRTYAAVTNGTDTLQAGIISKGSGLQRYVEYDGSFRLTDNAVKGTAYTPEFKKTATGVWSVTYDGSTLFNFSVPNTNLLLNYTQSSQSGGTCNSFAFRDLVDIGFNGWVLARAANCPFAEVTNTTQFPLWDSANCP